MTAPATFKFAVLDDLAFSAERGKKYAGPPFVAKNIGPIVELLQLSSDELLPLPMKASWLELEGLDHFCRECLSGQERWISPCGRQLGFLRTQKAEPSVAAWTGFALAAQQAAKAAGFTTEIAAQFAAVLGELRSNLFEHSGAPETGLVAFQATPNQFELAIADRGIGILESLRTSAEFGSLRDEGIALQQALTDGVSRFGAGSGRGRGFRPVFVGLANMHGELRFRSGDHALTITGRNPSLVTARIAQKPRMRGFMISIVSTTGSGQDND